MEAALAQAKSKLNIKEITFHQQRAVRSFLEGHDVFVSLPTGSGKSFIFQCAPICSNVLKDVCNSVALVITPIKALVDDQVKKLKGLNIMASSLIEFDNSDNEISIIVASPETVLENNASGRDKILSMRERMCGIFVDECHIVPKW
jgi:superfamily II DNA helicase RecQ